MRRDKSIKEEAVARICAKEAPLLDLAREYGVSTNTLRSWLRECTSRPIANESAAVGSSLAAMVAALPCGLIWVDAEGRILLANPAAEQLFGQAIGPASLLADLPLSWPKNQGNPVQQILSDDSASMRLQVQASLIVPDSAARRLNVRLQAMHLPETHTATALLVFM